MGLRDLFVLLTEMASAGLMDCAQQGLAETFVEEDESPEVGWVAKCHRY